MEDSSWEYFHLHTEMECGDDYFMEKYNAVNIDGDDFLREILLQTPEQSLMNSESENGSVTVNVNGDVDVAGNMVKSNSSNSIVSQKQEQQQRLKSKKVDVPRRSSSPTTYILSFDNSTMVPATPEPCVNLEGGKRDYCSKSDYSKKNKQSSEIKKTNTKNQGVKKARSGTQCVDHVIAERKRRQQLTERFIALSATIPGLSKTDKASILRSAIDYVKQLQERVHELEEKQDKNVGLTSSVMVLNKINSCGINNNIEGTNSRDTSCDGDCSNIFPEIEVRVMGKEVLIEIHCEKQSGIELKLLDHIENLQLFVTGNSVLPFGKSAISITIIAQMGDGYKVKVHDLVKSIRQVLLKPQIRCESDPY
ncbi:transcription factor bHLH18-like isoform X1 [Trifolium pratense]|nr:transcription factor bHLH18-like isoform X1 [Trifolium pratense]XP_045830035.1 transcription factor bHLH18-like isoform X1 [Trifolium pratense]